MAQLTLTAFVSLDGVMQSPGGPREDTSGGFAFGGWLVPHADADLGMAIMAIFARADAFLFGRGTYDIFAAHWPRVADPADSIASSLNMLPKFIVSRTRSAFDWNASHAVWNVLAELPAIKARFARELQVHGSAGLAQTLLENNLVDEFRLLTFPVVLGSGKRLFDAGAVPTALSLVRSSTTSKGVVISVYRPAGKVQTGSFALE